MSLRGSSRRFKQPQFLHLPFIFMVKQFGLHYDLSIPQTHVSSDTFYIPEHFHFSNPFYTFLSGLNATKHKECHIPSLLPLLCGGKGFEILPTRVMHLKVILTSTGVGRDSAGGTALATGWTVRGSNPGEDEIFRNHPDRP